jgi:hypothetical protein
VRSTIQPRQFKSSLTETTVVSPHQSHQRQFLLPDNSSRKPLMRARTKLIGVAAAIRIIATSLFAFNKHFGDAPAATEAKTEKTSSSQTDAPVLSSNSAAQTNGVSTNSNSPVKSDAAASSSPTPIVGQSNKDSSKDASQPEAKNAATNGAESNSTEKNSSDVDSKSLAQTRNDGTGLVLHLPAPSQTPSNKTNDSQNSQANFSNNGSENDARRQAEEQNGAQNPPSYLMPYPPLGGGYGGGAPFPHGGRPPFPPPPH